MGEKGLRQFGKEQEARGGKQEIPVARQKVQPNGVGTRFFGDQRIRYSQTRHIAEKTNPDPLTKAELRTQYLAKRRAIPPVDAARWSATIQERVVALPELQRGDVYIYVAAPDEVETRGIIHAMLAQGRRVLAPIGRAAGVMDWGEVTSLEALTVGRFGFLGPAQVAERAEDSHRGIAIVPCVAFTAQGYRLGRGGGYYDRFLAKFDGPTIALAFEVQRAETLPRERHDRRIGKTLTELTEYFGQDLRNLQDK